MISKKQIAEIREHLEKAQNPLFFFDNDNDGLISFLLLRRYIDRGKGVMIRSFPALDKSYYRKIDELKPDYIFILDKPVVSEDFLNKAKEDNIPVVWIDHHQLDKKPDVEFYYNPFFNDKTQEPVSYLSYKIANRKEDIWLAMIGCISDAYLPDFYDEFEKEYPELAKKNPKYAFDVLYGSEIGKIASILNFSLKDSITNVVNMIRFMIKIKSPVDLLEESSQTNNILRKYKEISSKYQFLLKKAMSSVGKKLLFFQYGGDLSLSSDISNRLIYEFPDKIIVVAYVNDDIANLSLRGKNVRKLTLKAIEGIEGATGGGHEDATGAKINASDLSLFRERVEMMIDN